MIGGCPRQSSSVYRRSASFLLAVLLLSIAGCTTVKPPPAPVGPPPDWPAENLIEALAERNKQFRSLRALARVEFTDPKAKHGFQEAVLVQRPDQLRLETLSMLGAILIVTANSKEIIGYHPREGIFVRGARTKENLQRLTQMPLDLEEVTQLLVGLPPVNSQAEWKAQGNSLIFFSGGVKRDAVAFESHQAVPTRWERFDRAGQVELSARFSDYISTPAGMFPSKIQFVAHMQKKTLEIRYQDPEVNAALPAHLFSQQKPAHAQEVPIEVIGS